MAYTTIMNVPAPPCLKGHAYKLRFQENFHTALDVDMVPYSSEFHTWVNGIWFNDPPVLCTTADIQSGDGVCTLTWHKSQSPSYNTSIRTMLDFRYGYFEARLRFDPVEGSWPAFWLLSSESMNDRNLNGGEFDVMEWMSSTPTKCFYNFHKWGPGGAEMAGPWKTVTFERPEGFDFNDYHTYAMLWTPGNVDCYIDNVYYGSCPTDHQIEMNHYYLILGSQAGLNWKCDPDTLAQIQAEQIQMQINWVRVWQQQA